MKALASFLLVMMALAPLRAADARAATLPSLDKTRFGAYVRYAEGLTEAVAIVVDDPTPSANPAYSRVVVHLTAGKLNLGDKLYYVTPDGQTFVNGSVWKLDQSPFEDIFSLLPANGPSFGSTDPKVKVVVFSDFQCPFCKGLADNLRQNLPKTFGNDVQVQFADYPLETKHPWAVAAAEASHCIGDHNVDAFWKFHDWMFAHQTEIAPEGTDLKAKILDFVKTSGFDSAAITACMESHATAPEVKASEARGNLVGVQQTPTLFVDGRKVEGALPWPNLQALLKFELDRPKNIPIPTK